MAEVSAMLARLGVLAAAPEQASDAVRVDRIAVLERLRGAVAAAQHGEMVAFARSQVEAHIADSRLDARHVGRGIGDQIGLACRVSPFTGARRLAVARALHSDLPGIRALLAAGRVSEDTAAWSWPRPATSTPTDAARSTACSARPGSTPSPPAGRRCSPAPTPTRPIPQATWPAAAPRAATGACHCVRPPDTMTLLTGFLPVEQGVACLAALRRRADTLLADGDARTRGQIMADTLVERVTGKAHAADVDVEVGILMPLRDLLHPRRGGIAEVVGHGPIPAGIARDLLHSSQGRRWWRRLFTLPDGGPLVGGDPRRRCFDGFLARLIGIRDGGRCRDPYCDAPIRHIDHIHPHRAGGPTTLANGRGVCARGNYVREMPGWRVDVVHDGLGRHPHTVRITTPTGHTYTSTAGPAP